MEYVELTQEQILDCVKQFFKDINLSVVHVDILPCNAYTFVTIFSNDFEKDNNTIEKYKVDCEKHCIDLLGGGFEIHCKSALTF